MKYTEKLDLYVESGRRYQKNLKSEYLADSVELIRAIEYDLGLADKQILVELFDDGRFKIDGLEVKPESLQWVLEPLFNAHPFQPFHLLCDSGCTSSDVFEFMDIVPPFNLNLDVYPGFARPLFVSVSTAKDFDTTEDIPTGESENDKAILVEIDSTGSIAVNSQRVDSHDALIDLASEFNGSEYKAVLIAVAGNIPWKLVTEIRRMLMYSCSSFILDNKIIIIIPRSVLMGNPDLFKTDKSQLDVMEEKC